MDGERFDHLARLLATGSDRRRLIKGVIGSAFGGVGLGAFRSIYANECRPTGGKCGKDSECCSQSCDLQSRVCVDLSTGGGDGQTTFTVTAASGQTFGRLNSAAARDDAVRLLQRTISGQGFAQGKAFAWVISDSSSSRALLTQPYFKANSGSIAMLGFNGSAAALALFSGGVLSGLMSVNNGKVQLVNPGTSSSSELAQGFAESNLQTLSCDQCVGTCGVAVDVASIVSEGKAGLVDYGTTTAACLVDSFLICDFQAVFGASPDDTALCMLNNYQQCGDTLDYTTVDGIYKKAACSAACNLHGDCASTPPCSETLCNGACVYIATDSQNCGGCGNRQTGEHICMQGETCVEGACVSTLPGTPASTPTSGDGSIIIHRMDQFGQPINSFFNLYVDSGNYDQPGPSVAYSTFMGTESLISHIPPGDYLLTETGGPVGLAWTKNLPIHLGLGETAEVIIDASGSILDVEVISGGESVDSFLLDVMYQDYQSGRDYDPTCGVIADVQTGNDIPDGIGYLYGMKPGSYFLSANFSASWIQERGFATPPDQPFAVAEGSNVHVTMEIACKGGLNYCHGSCSDYTTDPNNCGSCGNTCPHGSGCQQGICQSEPVATPIG